MDKRLELDLVFKERIHNAVLSSLGVNVAVLDRNGRIIEVNDSWLQFGMRNGAQLSAIRPGVNYLDVCRLAIDSSPEAGYCLDGILAVLSGTRPYFLCTYPCNSDQEERWYEMRVSPSDITEGVLIAHQPVEGRTLTGIRYGEILESARAIVWAAELPGFKTTYASRQTLEILGFPAEVFVNDPQFWMNHLHPDDREWVLKFTASAVEEGRKHSFEYRMIDANGQTVWLRNIVNVVLQDGHPRRVVGITTDITQRKEIEFERDEFERRLLRAQENERSKIARELHDDVGQRLALLLFQIAALANTLEVDSKQAQDVREINDKLLHISTDLQRISHRLHSPTLELLGLRAALTQQCREFASVSLLAVDYRISELPSHVHPDTTLAIYRILQECLRNVLKHSHASKVSIEVTATDDEICLRVSDNGVGFDSRATSDGIGLASMHERIRIIGGELTVHSTEGHGTDIVATAPLEPRESHTPKLY